MRTIECKIKKMEKWLNKCDHYLQPVSSLVNTKKPLVTIHCLAYNHENYIARCIESFLMQKVNFAVEIIVHDDCSTDSTREIINKYKNKFPHLIKTIYEKKNLCSRANNYLVAAKQMTLESRGEYIALCDGDDFWTDPRKLFIQVSLMQKFSKSSFCCHKVKVINEKTNSTIEGFLPNENINSSLISSKEFIKIISKKYTYQTSSYFFKTKDYQELFLTNPPFVSEMPTDDEAQLRYFGMKGPAIYVDKVMSTYRHFSSNSWSDKKMNSKEKDKNYERFANAVSLFDNFTNFKFHKSCLISIYKPLLFKEIENNNLECIFKSKNLKVALRSFGFKTFLRIYIKFLIKK